MFFLYLKLLALPFYLKNRHQVRQSYLKLWAGTLLLWLLFLINLRQWFGFNIPLPDSMALPLLVTLIMQILMGIPLFLLVFTDFKRHGSKLILPLVSLAAFYVACFHPGETAMFFTTSAYTLYIASLLLYLEFRYLDHTSQTLNNLGQNIPQTVLKKTNQAEVEVPISELKPGDLIKVKAQSLIPCDGEIVTGTTSVDESPITGESKPALKEKGDQVAANTLNLDSDILVTIIAPLQQNKIAVMKNLLHNLSVHPSSLHRKWENYAKSLCYAGILAGCVTLYYFCFIRHETYAISMQKALAVLVSFSPFCLSASVLLGLFSFTSLLTKKGILLKKADHIETLARLKTIFFDKTGTLTRGHFEYAQMFTEQGNNTGTFLSVLFSLQQNSKQALSLAMQKHPWYHEISRCPVKNIEYHAGLGVCGTIQFKSQRPCFAASGNLRFLKRLQMNVSRELKTKIDELEAMGETVLLCGYEGQARGLVGFSDTLRPGVEPSLKSLKKMKVEPAIVTGDSIESLSHLIDTLKLEKVYPRCTPQEKIAKIQKEVSQGNITGFVSQNEDPNVLTIPHITFATDVGTQFEHQKADTLILGSDFQLIPWLIKQAGNFLQTARFSLGLTGIFCVVFSILPVFGLAIPELSATLVLILNLCLLRLGLLKESKV